MHGRARVCQTHLQSGNFLRSGSYTVKRRHDCQRGQRNTMSLPRFLLIQRTGLECFVYGCHVSCKLRHLLDAAFRFFSDAGKQVLLRAAELGTRLRGQLILKPPALAFKKSCVLLL